MIVDLRADPLALDEGRYAPAGGAARALFRGRGIVRRDPSTIDAIVLHQTACLFGVSAPQVRAAGGDERVALHRRAMRIPAHATVFQRGDAVIASDLAWYLYHANRLNSRSLGIEVEGRYSGEVDRGEVPDVQVDATREALAWLVREGRAAGMPIRYVLAHRQSHPQKPGDPGAELWRRVVLEHAVPVLGLEMQPDLTVGGGRSIPASWGRP